MKRLILLVLLADILLSFSLHAQKDSHPCILSKRVGPLLDSYERKYFGLFPEIAGFVEARAFQVSADSFILTISKNFSQSSPDTTINLDRTTFDGLRDYLENFEHVLSHPTVFPKNLLLQGLITTNYLGSRLFELQERQKREKSSPNLKIYTKTGQEISTKILWASDSLLVTWKNASPYDWRYVNESVKLLFLKDIQLIVKKRKSRFWRDAGLGSLIGGGAGALIGFASGDDPPGVLSFTAEEKAKAGFIAGAVSSFLIGGIIGATRGKNIKIPISGQEENDKANIQKLREFTIFQVPPPELLSYIRAQKKRN